MAHRIIIELYDHTSDAEADEFVREIRETFQPSGRVYAVRGLDEAEILHLREGEELQRAADELGIELPSSSSRAPQYDTPEWLLLGVAQTVRCGVHGRRREQDTRHAAWIRREAKKRGLKAHVTLVDGAAHVRLTRP